MARSALAKFVSVSLGGAALMLAPMLATPAAAQFYSDGYEFLQAVKDRDGTEATDLLNKPGTTVVNARDLSTGETGLHYTVERRDLTWTQWLLQEGANPNISDNRGRTPLIVAAELGFIEGVEALVAGGAQVDIANQTGETPLIAAVHSRNIELIEVLLRSGADPDRNDNAGRSARDYAMLPGVPQRILSTIERNEQSAEQRESGRIYGPVF